jgi:hypothetical protein
MIKFLACNSSVAKNFSLDLISRCNLITTLGAHSVFFICRVLVKKNKLAGNKY